MDPASNKVHSCTICGQSFGNSYEVNSHMSLHLGDKKYVCSLCGKKFFDEKSLDLHITIHATEIKYEGLSTSSEDHMILSDQASSLVSKHEDINKVSPVKVRVKSFPVNAINRKVGHVNHRPDNSVIDFELAEEEFDIIEESEVYTTHGEVYQEKKPVQLKVWSKDQGYSQSSNTSTTTTNPGKMPYVIKVLDDHAQNQKAMIDSNPVKVTESQSQEPIRIFVGSNIRIENFSDLNNISQVSGFRNADISQFKVNNEHVYSYETYEVGNTSQEEYDVEQPLREEMDEEDLQSLQDEMDDMDDEYLQSLQDEVDDDEMETSQEGEEDVHLPQEEIGNGDEPLPQEDMDSEDIQLPLNEVKDGVQSLQKEVDEDVKVLQNNKVGVGRVQPQSLGKADNELQTVLKDAADEELQAVLKEASGGDAQLLQISEDNGNVQSAREEVGAENVQSLPEEVDFGDKQVLQKEVDIGDKQLLQRDSDIDNKQLLERDSDFNDKQLLQRDSDIDGKQSMRTVTGDGAIEHPTDESRSMSQSKDSQKVAEPVENDKFSDNVKKYVQHSNDRPHKCAICGLGFRFSFYLKAHLSIHSNDNQPYSCELCNRSFKTSESYKLHIKVHENQKPVNCPVCLKECRNFYQAKRHLETHNNSVPNHECTLCHEKFLTYGKLRTHLKTHTVHKCYICDKIFKEGSKLRRHIGSHLNKKLYHCKVCNRTLYCQPSDIERHESLHESVFQCSGCCKEFSSQVILKRHKKKCPKRNKDLCSRKRTVENVDASDNTSEGLSNASRPQKSEDEKKVCSKVAELLIDEILKDISEEDMSENICHETQDWLESISEGVTTDKFMQCISDCSTKDDIIRAISLYLENDVIKDAVSDCLLRERIDVQRVAQMMDASELVT